MTETDPDASGPDTMVPLRCYLKLTDSLWFFAGCQGRKGCGHTAPISVRAAIWFLGSSGAMVGELGTAYGAVGVATGKQASLSSPTRARPRRSIAPGWRRKHGRGCPIRWAGEAARVAAARA